MGLSFFPALLCRCPAKPFEETAITPDITTLLNDAAFMEAIHLASPVLYEQCRKYQAGVTDASKKQKLQNSLTKYYNRMRSRPTPFGLFSGCTTLQWGAGTRITLDSNKWQRHIRFDVDFLCALVQELQQHKTIRHQLHYRFNTSVYKVGNEYRYYEYQLENNQRKYQVSAVAATPLLVHLLALCGKKETAFYTLRDHIIAQVQVPAAEAEQYLEALIQSQLLESNLHFQVTGVDYLDRIIRILEPIHAANPDALTAHYLQQLLQLQQQLREAPAAGYLPAALEAIGNQLNAAGLSFQENRLFQLDGTVGCSEQTIHQQLQEDIIAALEVLQVLCAGQTDSPWLQQLKAVFASRYDTEPVPLTHIIDPDTGIITNGGGGIELDGQPLQGFAGSAITNNSAQDTPDRQKVQNLITEKLLQAFKHDDYSVTFTDAEINGLRKKITLQPLPATFSVMFSFVNDGNTILMENAGGASGSALIGRFGHTDATIRALLQSIHAFEQGRHPGSILSSVVHLPEDRTGNILQHPAVRCLEIPYLAHSSLPPERQLSVSDLYITLQNNELILYSPQHEKNVLPRIDNAHNYVFNTLPLYRLLGELQGQGKQTALSFSWNITLPGIHFFPRVQYREVILCPAQWHLPSKHYKDLLQPGGAAAFYLFASKWKLPPFFVLANGDQNLLVDQEDMAGIQAFISAIKDQQQIVLKEFLYASGTVKDEHNKPYAHQIIAVVKNETPANDPVLQTPVTLPERHFAVGSEWLYFKLYCSTHYANELLQHTIAAAAELFLLHGLADRWFFIRYQDPEPHLRVRFHLTNIIHTGAVIHHLQTTLQHAIQSHFVWKVQTDTYCRELERYGAADITAIEQLFYADSTYVLQQLQQHTDAEQAPSLLFSALQYADDLLTLFHFTLPQKLAFVTHYQDAFEREFNPGKEEKEIYNQYYRQHTAEIQLLLQNTRPQPAWAYLLPPLLEKRNSTALQQLAGDLLHMHINRLFHMAQRRYEMIIYSVLYKHYRSMVARQGSV